MEATLKGLLEKTVAELGRYSAAKVFKAAVANDVHLAATFGPGEAFSEEDERIPIKQRYSNAERMLAALQKGSRDLLEASIVLLALVDPAAAAPLAAAIAGLKEGSDAFARGARARADDALTWAVDKVPLETLIDLGGKGLLEGSVDEAMENPAFEDEAQRLAALSRIPKVKTDHPFLGQIWERIGALQLEDNPEAAEPLLAAIWSDRASPYRAKTGELLLRLGSPSALAKLSAPFDTASGIAELPEAEVNLAVAAVFAEGGGRPAEKLLPRFLSAEALAGPAGVDAACSVLSQAEGALRRGRIARDDARWIDACARLLAEPALRRSAKMVLTAMDPAAVKQGLGRAGVAAPGVPKAAAKVKVPAKLDLLARYKKGDHEKVWEELRAFGAAVQEEPLRKEAYAVALEAMRRLETNIDLLVKALKKGNYPLAAKKGMSPAKPDAKKKIDAFEKLLKGPLPLTLRAFYEVFEWVSLAETLHADYTKGSSYELFGEKDPLMIGSLATMTAKLKEQQAENDKLLPELRDPRKAYLAPTSLCKYDPDRQYPDTHPLLMPVPDPRADGVVELRGAPEIFFIDYLRQALGRGGFRGAEDPARAPEVEALTKGLLPI